MAHVIHLTAGAFITSLAVKGHAKSWEAHDRNQQFGENESTEIGKSQRLRKEGNARIIKVLAMRPGWIKIIEKVHISWYFESPETDLHIAENACYINYSNTWSPKAGYGLLQSKSPHCCTFNYRCEDMLELYTAVDWARLPIMGIHPWVASNSIIQWILVTLYNSGWMDNCQLCHGSIEVRSILDPLYVGEAYSHITSRDHSVQWHAGSHGWCDPSFGQEEDSM